MRLFTSKMCPPPRIGKSEVGHAKPCISPFTRKWRRVPQTLPTSNGMRIIVQASRDRIGSSAARDVLKICFGFRFTGAHRGAILLRRMRLILLGGRVYRRACSFFDDANAVDVHVLEFLKEPAGPAYLYPVDLGGGA